MSWRLYRPRRIGTYEARIVRRVLQIGAELPPSPALLASIDHLRMPILESISRYPEDEVFEDDEE